MFSNEPPDFDCEDDRIAWYKYYHSDQYEKDKEDQRIQEENRKKELDRQEIECLKKDLNILFGRINGDGISNSLEYFFENAKYQTGDVFSDIDETGMYDDYY